MIPLQQQQPDQREKNEQTNKSRWWEGDILTYSETFEDHLIHLKMVLELLAKDKR